MSSPQGSTWVSASVKNKNDLTATVSVSGAFHLGYAWQYSATTNLYVDGVYLTSGTSGSGSSYTDIGSASGSKDLPRKASAYTVTVKAYSYGASGQYYGGISGDSSATTTVTIDAYPIYKPDAPSNGSATRDNDNKVSLSWKNNTSTTKPYSNLVVQRSVNGGNWSTLATLGGSATTYTDTTTGAGSYYSYRVHSTNGKGASADLTLGTVYMTPSAPTNLRWERVANTTVKLIMTNNTTTATALEVQKRKTSADQWVTVATISGKVTEANVNVEAGEWFVQVRNTRGNLASAWVATADKVIAITKPNPPTLLTPASSTVISKSDGQVRFEWTHNPVDGTPQTAAKVTWRKQGTTTDNVITVGTDNYATLDLASIEPETVIEWYVQTKGAHNDYSNESAKWSFEVDQVPTIQVTAPTGIVASTPIEYGFRYDDTPNKGIASHTVEITDSNGNEVYRHDGGTEKGGTIPREDFLPTNGETYTVTVRATSTSTLSNSANNTFHVEYDLPVGASIETQPDAESGAVTVIVDPLQQQYGYKNIETNTDTKIAISEPKATANKLSGINAFTNYETERGVIDEITVNAASNGFRVRSASGADALLGAFPHDVSKSWRDNPTVLSLPDELRPYAMQVTAPPAMLRFNYYLTFDAPNSTVAEIGIVYYDAEYNTIPYKNGSYTDNSGSETVEGDTYGNYHVIGFLDGSGKGMPSIGGKPIAVNPPSGTAYASVIIRFYSVTDTEITNMQFIAGVTPPTTYTPPFVEVDTEIQPKDNVSGLTVYGKSEQKQYSGKNLVDMRMFTSGVTRGTATNITNSSFTMNKETGASDTYTFYGGVGADTLSADYRKYAIPVTAGKSYTWSFGTSANGASGACYAAWWDASYNKISFSTVIQKTQYRPYEQLNWVNVTAPANAAYLTLRVGMESGNPIMSTTFFNIQLEEGETYTEYEPYTGGIPAPNPQYPQEVYSVEGRNLLDYDTVWKVGYYDASGNFTENADYHTFNPIRVEPGVPYTLSCVPQGAQNIRVSTFDKDMHHVYRLGNTDNNGLFQFTPDANVAYVVLFTHSSPIARPLNAQLERGTTATPYVPYGSLEVVSRGKNLWNPDGRSTNQSGADRLGNIVPPGTYTLTNNEPVIAVYYRDGVSTADGSSIEPGHSKTVTFYDAGVFWVTARAVNVQLEQGSTATPYEPYTATSTTIDLQGHSLASLPDGTRDELVVNAGGHVQLVKRVGVVDVGTLDGWGKDTHGYWVVLNDLKHLSDYSGALLCNKYIASNRHNNDYVGTITGYYDGGNTYPNQNWLYIMDLSFADIYTVKTAMQGVMLYYELATPETIDLGNIGKIGLVRPETYMNVNTSIDTNAIVTVSRGGIDAVGYDIQRISDNGTVTILANADGHTAYQDRYAPANVDYTYRVVTYADSGAFEVSEEGARLDTPYFYVMTDKETAKARYNPSASQSISCADTALVRFAGRRYPVLYEGDSMGDSYNAGGVVVGKDSMEPFRRIQYEGGKAVYKSHDGDVIHVHSQTSVTRNMTTPPTYEVSVAMERIDGKAV